MNMPSGRRLRGITVPADFGADRAGVPAPERRQRFQLNAMTDILEAVITRECG
jgi:hypothetical protein